MKKWNGIFFGVMLSKLFITGLPVLEALPRYALHVDVRETDLSYQSDARITLHLEDPALKTGACLYLPLEDPLFRRSAEIHSLTGHSVRDQASRINPLIQWSRPDLLESVRPGYWRLTRVPEQGLLDVAYSFRIPGWKDHPERPRIMNDFYPRVLPGCPEPEPNSYPLQTSPAHFTIDLRLPSGWSAVSPGQQTLDSIAYEGRDFFLVLYQKAELKEWNVEGLRFRMLGVSETFFRLERAIRQILRHHHEVLKVWPSRELLVLESDEFEPNRATGLVVINRPQQALMRTLQEDFLNWNTWQLTLTLAEQWFGHQVKAARLEDIWLLQSLAETMGLLFLSESDEYSNLFTADDDQEPWFSLNFGETQDLLAATLSLTQSHNALLDAKGSSLIDIPDRPPYAFVRASQALRLLLKELGRSEYQRLLRELIALADREILSPQSVSNLLAERFDREGHIVSTLFQTYLKSDVWPDPRLIKVTAIHGQTLVELDFKNDLRVPVDVELKTNSGQKFIKRMDPSKNLQEILFETPLDEVDVVEIDPSRSIYDSDRFNNSSALTHLNFFPGNARNLADDAYTILWAPFLQKLPGNDLSVQLGWQLFRYVGTGLTGLLVHHPQSGKMGYRLLWQQSIPERSLSLNMQSAQDDDKTLPGERLTDITIAKRPLFSHWSLLDLYTRQRLRQTLGSPNESHLASALGFTLHSQRRRVCNLELSAEQEQSTWVPNGSFHYQRSFGLLKSNCEVPGLQWKTHFFSGVSKRHGLLPGGGLFNPQDVDEARLRLDRPQLQLAGRLNMWSTDIAVPLRLPLPQDLLVLPRRSLFKLFADGGHIREPEHRVVSSGVGLVLPIGGDVVGKQPITFLEFSLLSVLYRKIDQEVDSKPGLLFDFSGQL